MILLLFNAVFDEFMRKKPRRITIYMKHYLNQFLLRGFALINPLTFANYVVSLEELSTVMRKVGVKLKMTMPLSMISINYIQ